MADETINVDHPAELIHDLGDLERSFDDIEVRGRPKELQSFEAVTLDTSDGKKATRATYKKLTPPTALKLGELRCLALPQGMTLDKFKEQQAGLNRVFVCTGKAFVNNTITALVAFRPKS